MLGGRINEDILLNDLMCPLLITRLFSRFIERKKFILISGGQHTFYIVKWSTYF